MTDAVIVSTARTPIGKAYRGALNATEGATLLGHAIGEAVARAKVDPKEVEDVVMGAALQQGSTGGNIARKALLRAGLPVTVGGTTYTVDTNWHKIKMASTTAGQVIFTFDNNAPQTITSNVPTAGLFPIVIMTTQAASAEFAEADFFAMKWRGLGR